MSSISDGHSPPDFDAFDLELERHAQELRGMLEREAHELERLKAKLDEVRKRHARVQRAIDVLSGETSQAKAARTRMRTPRSNDWHVSAEKIEQVWQHVRGRTQPFSVNGLAAELDGISNESTRKAMNVLRERELVRVTGAARGGGNLLLPMPNTDDVESVAAYGA